MQTETAKHRRTLKPSPSDIERINDLAEKRAYKNMTPCKCPICGKQYKKKIFYTGRRLPARINCDACSKNYEFFDLEICEVHL